MQRPLRTGAQWQGTGATVTYTNRKGHMDILGHRSSSGLSRPTWEGNGYGSTPKRDISQMGMFGYVERGIQWLDIHLVRNALQGRDTASE